MFELVIVLILLSIFATVVASRFGSNGVEIITNTDILKSHLRYAQIKAMGDILQPNSNKSRWEIYIPDTTSYTLYRRNDSDVRIGFNLPDETPLSPTHTLLSGVTLASSRDTIAFNDWGIPVDGSGDPLSADVTITLSDGSQTASLTITKNTGYIP
ncbi:MAG: hypothetical protein KKC46_07535 [Proteobacteria bacterium]|nr:hypothetical protein [Pseudomonadota bacterium]